MSSTTKKIFSGSVVQLEETKDPPKQVKKNPDLSHCDLKQLEDEIIKRMSLMNITKKVEPEIQAVGMSSKITTLKKKTAFVHQIKHNTESSVNRISIGPVTEPVSPANFAVMQKN